MNQRSSLSPQNIKQIQLGSLKSQQQLQQRLYDKGFNLETMPSVKRPKATENSLTAKLKKQNQMNDEQIISYKQQSFVFNKLTLPSLKKNTMENFITQPDITNDEIIVKQNRSLSQMIQKPNQCSVESMVQKGLPNRLNSLQQIQTNIFRTSASLNFKKPINKSQDSIMTIQQTNILDKKFTQDNSIVYDEAGNNKIKKWEEKDIERSLHLIDKLSGKFNIDKRYTNMNKKINSNPSMQSLQSLRVKQNQSDMPQIQVKVKKDETKQLDQSINNSNLINVSRRVPSKLDKYIDLILKNVTNVNEFIYLKRQSEDDPYDLQVIDFKKIQEEQITGDLREYYTISRKGLCQYINGKPLEFIPLSSFLKERETFDQIKSLEFFTKFRKWKTLKMWKKNVIRHKNITVAKQLQEKLFLLNPFLSKTLLQYRLKTQELIDTNKFIGMEHAEHNDIEGNQNHDPVFSFQKFKEHQEMSRKKINSKITEYSNVCREIVRNGFNSQLNDLKKNQYVEDDLTKGIKKQQEITFFKLKENAYELLGFSDNMTYEKRSELRRECSKFLKFGYLVDFIALDALLKIYNNSITALRDKFIQILNYEDDCIVTDMAAFVMNKDEPMFMVDLDFQLDPKLISEKDYEYESLNEFAMHPIGNSHPEDFNFLYHVRLKNSDSAQVQFKQVKKPNKTITENTTNTQSKFFSKIVDQAINDTDKTLGNTGNEDFEEEILNEFHIYKRIIIPNITKLQLKIQPSKQDLQIQILQIIQDGSLSMQAFERWSKHQEMKTYLNVLEEWDDIAGGDWENCDQIYLNHQELLDVTPEQTVRKMFKSLIENAFNRAEDFIALYFQGFLMQYWEYQQINFDLFKHEKLFRIGESYYYTLQQLNKHKEIFEKKIPYYTDIGLLRIDSRALRKQILIQPQKILKQFQDFVPNMLQLRNDKMRKWAIEQANLLKGNSSNIIDFVRKYNHLIEAQKQFPKIKLDFFDNDYIMKVFLEFKYEINKQVIEEILETQQDLKRLDNIILTAEEQSEKNLERYANNVIQQLIPDLQKQINELNTKASENQYLNLDIGIDQAIKELTELDEECNSLVEKSKLYNHYEQTLNLSQSQFEYLEKTKSEVSLRFSMWKSLKEWMQLTEKWTETKFNDINVQEIKQIGEHYNKIVARCSKNMPSNPVLEELKSFIYEFKETMPVVVALRNKDLQELHWKEIVKIIGGNFTYPIDSNFKLKDLINMDVVSSVNEIHEVSTQATQEAILKNNYENLNASWKLMKFTVTDATQGSRQKDLVLLTDIEELYTEIDDLLANLNNILGSRYLKTIRDDVDSLQKKVVYCQETIDDMLTVQKNWIYLENIFKSVEIKQKLKDETHQFEKVDVFFKKQMNLIKKNLLIFKCISSVSKKDWNKQKEILNSIQQALDNLLEEKRSAFPRFYFLSNDELLEILAKSSDLEWMQRNMKKCFDSVQKLIFSEGHPSKNIIGMQSPEGEQILFQNRGVSPKGEIEVWLLSFQDMIRDTLSKRMKQGKKDYLESAKEREQWVLDHPAQIIVTIAQIIWTQYSEHFIQQQQENSDTGLNDWSMLNQQQLESLTRLISSGNLTEIQHKTIVSLITQDVHARDIVENMLDENVTQIYDFIWQKQLRYYQDENSDEMILVKQINSTIKYGYEYMGATSRLVITPLTDRCWITVTGAINIKLGANPAGPAGTGKTESVKDLSKGLGLLCVVFNCSDQIEYKMMGRLFSGLAEQGAWSCLDEFNRIDIEVLSVIAQQLLTIRIALTKGDEKFQFGDKLICLKAYGYGVFTTMNPGYAGRTELPENLKVLFRPVAMMIPDYGMIAEIMLFSEGFENASTLSKKMVQLYKLSSEQLSQQNHYDFGMRAVKSVLNMAGNLKRGQPNLNEDAVLIRAMRDSNLPKFLKEDLPLFNALIQDLFPAVQIPIPDYQELTQVIEQQTTQLNYQLVPKLTGKVIQLYETFAVRFGVMLVGQTTSGKTTCYRILQKTMTELSKKYKKDKRYNEVTYQVINPKSISMGELYGEVNLSTQEWNDGLASQILRAASANEQDVQQWNIFDGPIDSLWIENMNTVLDDNMMLCLANGQRIKLKPSMRILFEVSDLKVASPASVSRCGMVYMTQEDIGWRPYVSSWIEDRFKAQQKIVKDNNGKEEVQQQPEILSEDIRNYLFELFESTVDPTITQLRNRFQELIITIDLQLVISLCNLLDCFICVKFGFNSKNHDENIKRFLCYTYAFCFIWSLGITISDKYHKYMDKLLRDLLPTVIFPSADNVYGYYLDNCDFKHWNDKVEGFQYDENVPYFNLLVQTIDTCRYSYIVEWLCEKKKNVYLTGYGGTGKSVIIQSLLEKIKETSHIDNFQLIFSAQTSSYITQVAIEDKLKKKSKQELGALPGRQNIIFIDDVNMPQVEAFGAQPPIELLRQFLDHGFVWDRKERFLKFITDTSLICCSAPPGGGRSHLTPRFTRHFNILSLSQPSQQILFKIFNCLLSGFFETTGFQPQVKICASQIVESTIGCYLRISAEKLPIPAKFHYTFNIRDVSKVFQGIMMCSPRVIHTGDKLINLWIHEVSRVFHDRLTSNEDQLWFYDLIIQLLNSAFKNKEFFRKELFEDKSIIFSDILKLEGDKEYEEILDQQKLNKVLSDKLDDYNDETNSSKMHLIFFEQAILHLLRIMRILRQIRGNVMLIGVGGSGKQSLTRLGSFILQNRNESIEIKKDYNQDSFRQFIQTRLMHPTGVEGQGVTFLFNDTQIIQEAFLEDINNILNSGEVPNMWRPEEKDLILNEMKDVQMKLKKAIDPDTCWKSFVERVRYNLHVVLCMSPIGDSLRIRCRQFPSLIDCCNLDWFTEWPESALQNVAFRILQEDSAFPLSKSRNQKKLIQSLSIICKDVHILSKIQSEKFEQALKRKVYNTPKSYLDLLKLFRQSLKEKNTQLCAHQGRLSSGLTKLEEANVQIAQLQIKLTELQPELEKQNIAVAEAIIQVEKDTLSAQQQEVVVSEETEKVQKQKDKIQLIADDANTELDKVMPELQKAQEAVEKIDRNQLVNLRSMPNPPPIVLMVFEGVCALMGQKQDWVTAKQMLLDLNKFIASLINFDKDNIPPSRLKKLNKVLARPEFDIPSIQQKVAYAADMAMFCKAMKIYADTNEKVKPKREQVAKLQSELDIANSALNTQLESLNKVKQNVQRLRDETNKMLNRKESLEIQMKQTETRLENAKKLISLTADEGKRWSVTVGILNQVIDDLFGDVFLAAAQISYAGPFTGIYRKELLDIWMEKSDQLNIPRSSNYSLVKTLGDPMQLRDWMIKGLPSDMVSQESSILVTQGYRWPLLIDPQLQASKWIKNIEHDNDLKLLKLTNNWIRTISNAISNGQPVLIQDIDETLDPGLESVLSKAFYEVEGRNFIRFGDNDIIYHKDFRVYLTTQKPNPTYLPEIFIKVNVINFTSTFEGLEDQLLADVVKNEKPQVEKERDQNIQNLSLFRKKLEQSEKDILKLLAEAKAETILDDVELINTLEVSKTMAIEIIQKLKESEDLEVQINTIRNSYRAVSIRGSILYFVIKDFALIDPMYQYSLQYVQKLFNQSVANANQCKIHQERIDNLLDNITKTIFTNVCRGLFEKDKLIFSFLIAAGINQNSGILSKNMWNIFLRGNGVFDKSMQTPNPNNEIFSQVQWDLAYFLDISFEQFKGLTEHMTKNIIKWKDYVYSQDPLESKIPDDWDNLDIFEKMLILKICRPEKILFAVSNYVKHIIGKFYLESPHLEMDKIYQDSDFMTPIIFVLSQGADPTSNIIQFSKQLKMEEKLKSISLGQGQGEKAQILIEEGIKQGNWIFMQNCHLARTWMSSLENNLNNLRDNESKEVHKDFRIFITSMPASYFPVSILQNGIKLTTEPPRGLKANLKRSWSNISQEFISSCKKQNYGPIFHKLVWGLTYFHALIQERRKFGPLGWNIRYEFNDSDLETSIQVMKMLLEDQDQIPWDSMLFVSGHINYGGRVTDEFDRRCLITSLKNFFTIEIINDKYLFSSSPTYIIPSYNTVENYIKYIEDLPIHEDPQVFGLNENANLTYQGQESNSILQTILKIQPKTVSVSGKSNDDILSELISNLQDQLPPDLLLTEAVLGLFEKDSKGLISSLSTVLNQEMRRFNMLLKTMRDSLKNLKHAINGEIVMSGDLDACYYSILNNQVPSIWEKVAYLSLKSLARWVQDLIERVNFIRDWLINGNPHCYWLSGFFFPQGFITGVLQTHSRKYQTAIDQLDFVFRILDIDKETCYAKPVDGIYVYGLYIEGASWDRKRKSLCDQGLNQTYCQMPVIYFVPTDNVSKKLDNYSCPVYKTSTRAGVLSTTGQSTNYIIDIEIPSLDQISSFWTLRGTAMLCQLNY